MSSFIDRLRTPTPASTARPAPRPPSDSSTSGGHLPDRFVPPTGSLGIVNCVADALQSPPATITKDYAARCAWAASFLNVSPPASTSKRQGSIWNIIERAVTNGTFRDVSTAATNPWWGSVISPRIWTNDEDIRHDAQSSVSAVLALTERVADFAKRAKNAGYEPPDNPFAALAQANAMRRGLFTPLQLDSGLADDLVYNMRAYVALLKADNEGGVDLSGETGFDEAQMAHIKISFDGFGGSGNPSADILSFLPSSEELKREAARKALSVLDFSKRIPYLLFTLDYRPMTDAGSQGILLGWKKIPDASGYNVDRRDVFAGQDASTLELPNSQLDEIRTRLLPYARTYALSFFENIDERQVVLYLDQNVKQDECYLYTVQGFQVHSPQKGATFIVDSTPVTLTPASKQSIQQLLRRMSDWPDYTITGYTPSGEEIREYNNFEETISPWPAYSMHLYGDSNYDWLLAAVNIRASIDRGDDKDVTRKYSYLNAASAFLDGQADLGKFVKPASVDQVVKNIEDSIQKFGVSQTIQGLMDDTLISYYFEGREPQQDTHFDRAGTLTPAESKLFTLIGNAIDPETATLDLRHLATNMQALLSQQTLGTDTQLQPGADGAAGAGPNEVSIPDPDASTDAKADTGLQFITKLDMGDSIIDLNTFEGISKLLRAIRIFSDFGPNRRPANPPPADAPKPVPPPPPPPPPEPEPPTVDEPVDEKSRKPGLERKIGELEDLADRIINRRIGDE